MMLRRLGAIVRRAERGFTLIEVLVALGIFGFVGLGIMGGLATAYRAQDTNRVHIVGENLARAVLEEIRSKLYEDDNDYSPFSVPVPYRYSFTVTTVPYCATEGCTPDDNLQKNTVTALRGGEAILTVEDLKVRRAP